VSVRVGRAPGPLRFAHPAIADTPTVPVPVARPVGTCRCARRGGATNRVQKGGWIIAIISGRIGRAGA
jgi:hypothetical protein